LVYDADGLLAQAGALMLGRNPLNDLITGAAPGSVRRRSRSPSPQFNYSTTSPLWPAGERRWLERARAA